MPKVSQEFSYTFKPGNDQWCKVVIDIHEIDTEAPLDEQIRGVDNAIDAIWSFIRNKVDSQIEEVLDEVKKGKEK